MPSYGGIDLGGTKIQAVILNDQHEVTGSARRQTPTSGGPVDVAAEMEIALRDAAKAAELEPAALAGVGVGSPGTVEAGNVSSARNLPGWEGTFPLAQTLREALGCGVRLGNDVQVATDAEFRLGAGRLYSSLLVVSWGTGVGGGLILDGKAWRGRGGCVEAYAGGAAMEAKVRKLHEEKGRKTDLFKLMKEHGRPRLTSGIWARALEQGDKLAAQMLDRAVGALGAGIASAINLLDLQGVIMAGGLGIRLGHPHAVRIAEAMQPHLFIDSRPPHVHVSALGDLGGAIGAALLAEHDRAQTLA